MMWTFLLAVACHQTVALPPPPSPPPAEVFWAQRDDADALRSALGLYDRQTGTPDRWLLARQAQGWSFYATHHAQSADEKTAAWEAAMAAADACLALNVTFDSLRRKERESEATAARALGTDDVPCAHWAAIAWEGWLSGQGASTQLLARDVGPAYMARVEALDPDHFHGAVDRYWGRHHASLPPFAGQDLAQARARFEAARAAAPGFLGNNIEMAAQWAVAAGDEAAFSSLLEGALAADAGAEPAVAPENRAAQARARALLAEQGNLFSR